MSESVFLVSTATRLVKLAAIPLRTATRKTEASAEGSLARPTTINQIQAWLPATLAGVRSSRTVVIPFGIMARPTTK